MSETSAASPIQPNVMLARSVWLQRVMAFFALILMGVTWRLWLGQSEFPRIPLIPVLPPLNPMLISGVIGLILLDLLLSPTSSNRRGRELFFLSVLFGLTFLLNQHSLQTWAYQFGVMALLWASAKPMLALKLIRLFVISIYIYSALSKLDLHFVGGGGAFLLEGLLEGTGINTERWPDWLTFGAIAAMPIFELLVGIGLLIPSWRKAALVGSILVHLSLLKTLGPWGLNHSWGVLTWNVYFIVQNLLLFSKLPEESSDKPNRGIEDLFATFLLLVVITLPILNMFGFYDQWPSWAVYTSRQERITILIEESQQEMLPESARSHLDPPKPLESWRRVNLGAWSLKELGVPIYPQTRFHLAILGKWQQDHPELNPKVILHHSRARFSKIGEVEEFEAPEQIDELRGRYWLLD